MSEAITIKNFTATYWAIIIFFIYIGNGEFIVRHGQIQLEEEERQTFQFHLGLNFETLFFIKTKNISLY